MTIDQISIFVENQPGRLAEITEVLGDAGVDLRALSIADSTDFGILRVIVNDSVKALAALKEAGCAVQITPVLAVAISDEPGALAKVVRTLADGGLSVEYLYASVTRKSGDAFVILRIEDIEKAVSVLASAGVETVSREQLF